MSDGREQLTMQKIENIRKNSNIIEETPTYKNFYVAIVKQTSWVIDETFEKLMHAAQKMKRNFVYISGSGSALTISRTKLFETLKERIIENGDDLKNQYVLFIDNDIVIKNNVDELVEIFTSAEKKGINICGNYNKINNTSCILKIGSNDYNPIYLTDSKAWKDNNVRYVESYQQYYFVLGFLYAKNIPFDYQFIMNNYGEDINFVIQNPNFWKQTYFDKKLILKHYKTVEL